jgi:regulatory protein YycI of two-component signal transduction system YycFG
MSLCLNRGRENHVDWGKAKTVLIVAFVLLNLLLGYQVWTELRAELHANQKQAELPADKLLIMQQKNITLSASLPVETPKMGDITYLLEMRDAKDKKVVQLSQPVDSSIVFNEQQLRRTLGDTIDHISDYTYDVHSSSEGVFVLNRIVNGKPMFFTRLELYNSNLKITGYSQDRVEITGYGEQKTVLAASKIITSLVDSYLEENSVIIDIQLGYYGQIFDSDTQVATPAWRVMLDDAKIYYVDALSGEVLTDHAEQDDE